MNAAKVKILNVISLLILLDFLRLKLTDFLKGWELLDATNTKASTISALKIAAFTKLSLFRVYISTKSLRSKALVLFF